MYMYTYKLTVEHIKHLYITVSLYRHKFKVYMNCIQVVKEYYITVWDGLGFIQRKY